MKLIRWHMWVGHTASHHQNSREEKYSHCSALNNLSQDT